MTRHNYNTLYVLEEVVLNAPDVHPATAADHYRINHYFPALEHNKWTDQEIWRRGVHEVMGR